MKTRKNLTLFIAFIAFFLLTGNVIANADDRDFASGLEIAVDPVLELENWMLDDNYLFHQGSELVNVEYEEAMELENWMTEKTFFGKETIEYTEAEETEMEVESWMYNANFLGFE